MTIMIQDEIFIEEEAYVPWRDIHVGVIQTQRVKVRIS